MASETKQLPGTGEIFLDHVGWYAPDLDEVARMFKRLGFPFTPYSIHGDRDPKTGEIIPQGSANRLAMLERGYLEFLTDVENIGTPVARHLRQRMDKYIGVHLTAFTVADAEAEAERLIADGVTLQPTVNLRRTIEAEDGSEVDVAFSVVRAAFDLYPEGRIQTLTHHTPEHVWQHRYTAHDNGISELSEQIFMVDNPAESAGRLSAFTQRPVTGTEQGAEIQLDRGRLTFVPPESVQSLYGIDAAPAAPAVIGVGFISGDLAATRRYLKNQGVGLLKDEADRLIISPADAMGAALVVYPPG